MSEENGIRIDAEKLKSAQLFMESVRDKQRLSGKSLTGVSRLLPEVHAVMMHEHKSSSLISSVAYEDEEKNAALSSAFERFEEMCRRRHVVVPATLRGAIYRIMTGELLANANLLKLTLEQAVSSTVYCGDISEIMKKPAYAVPGDATSLFRKAAIGHSGELESYVKNVITITDRLQANRKLAMFRDTPSVFKDVALSHTKAPEEFLLNAIANIKRLSKMKEFAVFKKTPGMYKLAALKHSNDPDGFLRGVIKKMGELAQDEEFAALRDSPSLFRVAAATNVTDSVGHLRGFMQEVGALEQKEEYSEFKGKKVLRRAVKHSDADAYLKEELARRRLRMETSLSGGREDR